MSDFTKEDLERLSKELERSQRDRCRMSVVDTIYIEFDKGDTWFSINDADESSYDWMGGVLLSSDMIDSLIEVLTQLRVTLSRVEDKQSE